MRETDQCRIDRHEPGLSSRAGSAFHGGVNSDHASSHGPALGPPGTARPGVGVDADAVRSAKALLIAKGLLRSGDQPGWLPGEIDRSWRRSIGAGAGHASGTFDFVNAYDADSELCRAAGPVLDRLEQSLRDLGIAIFLADTSGQIVGRRISDKSVRVRLDNACAAEGFDFSEDRIGTNGLGTPMREDGAVFVRGPEHFNEALEGIACAGTAIRHPFSGRLMGSLSLAAPADAAEMLMLAMTREAALQIVERLGESSGRREVELGRSYRRHRDKGPVIVLNRETVMTNVTGLSFLNVEMHARLWDALMAEDWAGGPHVLDLDLAALNAQVLAHRLEDPEGDPAFAVEILDRAPATTTARRRPAAPAHADPFVAQLARAASGTARVLAVTGPSGAGKLHVTRAWLGGVDGPPATVLEAGDLGDDPTWKREAIAALEAGTPVVVRRLEDLHAGQANALKSLAAAAEHPAGDEPVARGRLLLTADPSRCSPAVAGLLTQLAATVALPPLAQRTPEIPDLVERLLAPLDPALRPVLSAATLQVLMRWAWPGNVRELARVMADLATEHPGRPVSPHHLPERMWEAGSRRRLTRIEAAERSEIGAAIRQAGGNRSRAAALLGISRSSLYRKLNALGLADEALR